MRTHGFLGSNVVDVSAGDAETARRGGETARARTEGGDGPEVGAVAGVPEVERAGGGDGVAEALGGVSLGYGVGLGGRIGGGWREDRDALTAVRLGQTQSNMSAPKAIHTIRSSG